MSSNDYQKWITDTSFELLKQFLQVIDKKNFEVVIIGGWATESFVEGIGSKDIDVVFKNDDDVQALLSTNFFKKDKYLIQQVYPLRYKKEVSLGKDTREIICDIFNADLHREDYEELGIDIHWKLTHQFKEKRQIRNLPVWVPKRELLIILKIIAAVDRSARLDKVYDDDENLESKIWKDYRDIAYLAAHRELDKAFLKKYIKESRLKKHMDMFLSRYNQPEKKQVLEEELSITSEEIISLLEQN